MVAYLRNRPGVTSLTRLSVHCAERMVATSSSQAFEWRKAQVAAGYISSSTARIFWTRAFRSAAVLGLGTRNFLDRARAPGTGSVEIDVALGWGFVRMLFRDLQHFVEFLAQHI